MTGRAGCALFAANVTPDPFPTRIWGSCGSGAWATGCEVAPIGLAIDTFLGTYPAQSAGTAIDGDIFVNSSMAFLGANVEQIFRLSDSATVAAVRIDEENGPCFFNGYPPDDPFLLSLMYEADAGGITDFFGVAQADSGIAWDQHWVTDLAGAAVNDSFDFDRGHGYVAAGEVASITSPSATTYTAIDPGTGEEVYSTAARHDLLLWSVSNATGGAVRGYTVANGVQDLVTTTNTTEPKFPLYVALSDDHMVWVTVTENTGTGAYDSLQFFWSPVATQASDVHVTVGPSLAHPGTVDWTLATGGDYAMVETCDSVAGVSTNCLVNVVQLSTQKLWAIPPRPGTNVFLKSLAITNDELVFGESNGVNDVYALRRIVRIKTSQLDALTK